ncbi:hypothetical protein FFI89_019030 [Bradyrhizobium sp. KBS0727]|uniref:hypothetical protein n=1 Tax=unclassified Bradyrhizobium TaxID=2631580 RepID=UPI00110DCB31|nr:MULTISPECIES: hypothetical protein [unclassified Bradyrhizobium]QDW39055.1 hypothetical protein FFI71_019030 [Bradyrhizobium sp. KBS0725]QDW45658.1 hypothetical protein FFI89_019030 [Bradyrhizobium sp. KBS0727]
MAASWLRRTALVVLLGLATAAPASAASPGNELTRLTDPDRTFTSPDGQVSVEQYSKKKGEDDLVYEFWAFDAKHEHGVLLNRDENTDDARYPAGFRFSPNSQWVVRMQKLGSGTHTLFLYRRNGSQFSEATPKPLGDMAWDYFYSQPISRQIHRKSGDRDSIDHPQVHLVKGADDNYASQGRHWPDSRYLVLSLSFDAQGEDHPRPWVEDWQCVFDTKTDRFSIPADLADANAKTVNYPAPKRK